MIFNHHLLFLLRNPKIITHIPIYFIIILFYKLDFAFKIIDAILFLINLIIIFCNKNVKYIENTDEGEKEDIEDIESLSVQDEIRIIEIEQEKEKLRIVQ